MTGTSPTKDTIIETSPKASNSKSTIDPHLNFPQAIEQIIAGKKVTKIEWDSNDEYAVLKDTFLMLHMRSGEWFKWIISDGDLFGTDYIVID